MIAHSRYRQTQTDTASRERVLLLLLQKAQACMALADAGLAAGNPCESVTQLQRALDIVAELCDSLDAARAPVMADNLGAVYGFVMQRLLVAQKGDRKALKEAQRAFGPVADAFEQAVAAAAR